MFEYVMGVNEFSCHVMKSKIALTETIVNIQVAQQVGRRFFRVEQVSACRLSSSYG
jgi:hypothetical protein